MRIPLEINFLGMMDHRHYPNPAFFEIAAQVGNAVVLGCDAHQPQAVSDPQAIARGEAMAAQHGLQIIDELTLVDPKACRIRSGR